MFEKKVFISHSAKNKEIANALSAYLSHIGVDDKHIFCSSVVGQGIENGKELGMTIFNKIKESRLLIFLLTRDFLDSSYCVEELGIGWYLSQLRKKTCFFIVLPDIELKDIHGFVNTNIQQFSIIELDNSIQFGQFIQDIISFMNIRNINIARLNQYGADFLNSIKPSIHLLNQKRDERIQQEKEIANQRLDMQNLKQQISLKEEQYKSQIKQHSENSNSREKLIELHTIERLLHSIDSTDGITRDTFMRISKTFWFNSIQRYIDLLELTNRSPSDFNVELLAATLFAIEGEKEKAREHINTAIYICEGSLHYYMIKNFLDIYDGSMSEAILTIREKLKICKLGLTRDSYINIIQKLEEREKDLSLNT